MRRAIIAAAATVVGLAALLDYRSSGAISTAASKVKVNLGSSGQQATSSTTAVPTTRSGSAGRSGTFTSSEVTYTYGALDVAISLKDGKITAVTVPSNDAADPRSQLINQQAVPILVKEALAAQGVAIDVVSGATFTSEAFGQALKDALAKAGK
jgi:uncharacterized protein with FMN-binding domain